MAHLLVLLLTLLAVQEPTLTIGWITAARDGSFVVETEYADPGPPLPRTFGPRREP